MAKIKVERGLNLGMPYTPDMQDGGKRPEPTWSTIRDQVREADALGYDTIVAVETQHDPYLELAVAAQEPSILEVVVSEPEPEPERGWEPEVPSWAAREQPRTEPEYSAPRTNGNNHQTYGAASGGEAGSKSLEDSVKDMLRPMLQRWLDENMTRVLTSALKDELRDNPARFHEALLKGLSR